MSETSFELFSPCPRGLEGVLGEELIELGIAHVEELPGGVRYRGDWEAIYRVNLHSRIASRVLMQIAQGPYRRDEDIYQLATKQDWPAWFTVDKTLRVDVTATKSPLRSLEFATLRIKDAVCDRFREQTGERPSIDTRNPGARVYAYLNEFTCTLYLDTSGHALFKRGWRTETGDAPVRENLAAGILRLSHWSPGIPLFDPMCGSGTFVIEAAQRSLGIAPGAMRSFGFENLTSFDQALWDRVRNAPAATQPIAAGTIAIQASDVSGDAVVLTRANLLRAGIPEEVVAQIAPKQIDARHIRAGSPTGVMVVNPPYGERLGVRGNDDADVFFREFGDTLKQRFAGWQCNILTSDMAFQKKLRLAPSRRTVLFNGAIECRLYRFELVEGSRKPIKVKSDA